MNPHGQRPWRNVCRLGSWSILGVLSACGGGTGPVSGPAGVGSSATSAITAPVSASDPITTPPVTVEPKAQSRTLIWSDEFDTPGLPDASKWSYDTERNRAGWYNGELQYYANARLPNSEVAGGVLSINALRETLNTAPDFGGQRFTSARLITRDKFSFTYGFVEVRAQLPCNLGTWPAIWMLGTGGLWPDDGEIDLMEQRGTQTADKSEVLGTVHTRAYNWSGGLMGVAQGSARTVPTACTAFHNYQLNWTPEKIEIGVDGVIYNTVVNPKLTDPAQNYQRWPFDKPQYLLLNLAMGGDLGGAVAANFTRDTLNVDYVRVYRNE